MQITSGRIKKALKIVLYGPEGIGKSSLAASFPNPVFCDTEGSTDHMDVRRFPKPSSWQMVLDCAKYAKEHPEEVGTFVLDTADWAERLEVEALCAKNGWSSIEGAGFGKGYTYSAEEFGRLLNILSEVAEKGINVVITAHAWLRKIELPEEMGAYDHWEMKTSKKVAPLIREWADAVLFLNYKVNVINVDNQGAAKGKNKAQGGRRVIHTNHTPFWDAKNRYGMPDELPLDYESIAPLFSAAPAPVTAPAKGTRTLKRTPEIKSSGRAATPATAPDPAPKEEDVKALRGFIAEQDLYFEKNGGTFMVKKGNMVPAVLLDGGRQIDKAEYDKLREPPVIEKAEDIAKVPVEYQEPDPRIPKSLRDLMIADQIDEWEIQNIASAKGYMPADTPVSSYPNDFLEGWCVGYWPQLKAAIMEAREKQELEYK